MNLYRARAILERRAEQYDAKAKEQRESGGLGVYAAKIAEEDAEAIRTVLGVIRWV